jgi:hypothetical protein
VLVKVYDGDRSIHEAGSVGEHWTLDEAARLLDPPVTAEQVRAMLHLAGVEPVGRRRLGLGRFRMVYDAQRVREAHSAVSPLLGPWEAGPGVQYYRTV